MKDERLLCAESRRKTMQKLHIGDCCENRHAAAIPSSTSSTEGMRCSGGPPSNFEHQPQQPGQPPRQSGRSRDEEPAGSIVDRIAYERMTHRKAGKRIAAGQRHSPRHCHSRQDVQAKLQRFTLGRCAWCTKYAPGSQPPWQLNDRHFPVPLL